MTGDLSERQVRATVSDNQEKHHNGELPTNIEPAELCDSLARSAPTAEERKDLLDTARAPRRARAIFPPFGPKWPRITFPTALCARRLWSTGRAFRSRVELWCASRSTDKRKSLAVRRENVVEIFRFLADLIRVASVTPSNACRRPPDRCLIAN
jgi:hypothetical protein